MRVSLQSRTVGRLLISPDALPVQLSLATRHHAQSVISQSGGVVPVLLGLGWWSVC